MRYSLEAKYRKYVQGYGFLSFARKFGDKYGKKLMNTATRTLINAAKEFGNKYGKNLMDTAKKSRINAAKTASKRVVQKTAKKDETNEVEEIYIPPEKRQQIIDDLRLF